MCIKSNEYIYCIWIQQKLLDYFDIPHTLINNGPGIYVFKYIQPWKIDYLKIFNCQPNVSIYNHFFMFRIFI